MVFFTHHAAEKVQQSRNPAWVPRGSDGNDSRRHQVPEIAVLWRTTRGWLWRAGPPMATVRRSGQEMPSASEKTERLAER